MAATYTVKQVAEILGYSTNSIYTFLKDKRIKGVRVGTGRFRIPQVELNRLLGAKKTETQVMTSEVIESGVIDVGDNHPAFFTSLGKRQIGLPNIFDWYVGIVAVIAGLAMFLFNAAFDNPLFKNIGVFVNIMQTIFIGCGVGIILSNTFGRYHNRWHKFFSLFLSAAGVILSVLLCVTGDLGGASIYGMLTLTELVVSFLPLGGIASMGIYMTGLGITSVLVPLFGSKDQHVIEFMTVMHVGPWMLSALLAVACAVYFPIFWWSYRKRRHVFWLCTWAAALLYFGFAAWYANDQYWARSFFFIATAIITSFMGLWEKLDSASDRKDRLVIAGTLGGIASLLIMGVVVVYLMQLNVLATVRRENEHKVQYAQMLVGSILQGIESSLVGEGKDEDLAEAVAAKDSTVMNDESRTIMNSNPNVRRVVILDAKGNGINLYPFGTFVTTDLSYRDYFIAVRDTMRSDISNLYNAVGDGSNRPVISISAPIIGKNNSFAGVIVASLDLDAMGAQLQKIAVPERGEFVVIVDSSGRFVVNPEKDSIGTAIIAADPVLLGAKDQRGTADGILPNGKRAIVTFDSVELTHWGVAIKTPYAHIYELATVANISIFVVLLATIIGATVVMQGIHLYRKRAVPPAQRDSS